MPTLNEIYADAITELNKRYRFPDADNLLSVPTDLEQQAAIMDSLAEINSFPPSTGFTLDAIYAENADPRLKYLLYLGAAKNILQLLVADWTANGYTLAVEEFNVEDRLDRYNTLLGSIRDQFDDRITKFKEATQKFSMTAYAGTNNPLVRYRPRSGYGPIRF